MRVRVQQLPWTAAHEKLLTAYAGDAAARPLPARQHLAARVQRARRARAARRADGAPPASRATTTSPASSTPTSCRRRRRPLLGLPWYVDTRLLFYRTDLLRAAGHARAAPDLGRVARRRCATSGGSAPAAATARCCPSTSPTRCSRCRCSKAPLLARRRHPRRLLAAAVPARARLLRRASSATAWRRGWQRPRSSNVWDEFARGLFAFYVTGPWNIGEFRRRLPRRAAGRLGHGAAAGPGRAGRLDRRRLEPRHLQELAAQGSGWKLIQLPERARDDAALSRPHRRPAAAAQRLAGAGLADDPPSQAFARQLERVRAAPKIPEWERIFQEMQLTAERVVAAPGRARRSRRRSSTRGSTRCSRSAAGCARAATRPPAAMTTHRRRRLGRWPRRRCWSSPSSSRCRSSPASRSASPTSTSTPSPTSRRCASSASTTTCGCCRRRSSGRRWPTRSISSLVGVPVSIGLSLGAALLLDSRFARWQALLSHRAVRAGRHDGRRRRRHLALPAAHALRPDQPGARPRSASTPVDWLGDPHWSMPAIILFAAWKNFGYNMVILLAALQAIPRELYEAARVDGAGALRQFTDLTLPMLAPTLVMVGIMTLVGLLPALRRALRDDAGRAAAQHLQRALLHVRGRLSLVEPRQRVGGRVPALRHDLRGSGGCCASIATPAASR